MQKLGRYLRYLKGFCSLVLVGSRLLRTTTVGLPGLAVFFRHDAFSSVEDALCIRDYLLVPCFSVVRSSPGVFDFSVSVSVLSSRWLFAFFRKGFGCFVRVGNRISKNSLCGFSVLPEFAVTIFLGMRFSFLNIHVPLELYILDVDKSRANNTWQCLPHNLLKRKIFDAFSCSANSKRFIRPNIRRF